MECWSIGVVLGSITPSLHYFITPMPPLRRRQKLLPDAQLGILRNENLADENFDRREIARRDSCGVIDVLEGIDEHGAGFVFEGVVIGPDGENGFGGIAEVNLEALFARKIQDD